MSLFRHLATKLRVPIPIFKNIRRINLVSKGKKFGVSILLSTTVIHDIGKNEVNFNDRDEMDDYEIANAQLEDFNNLIKKACEMTEEKVKELIKLLSASIQKSCEEYRKVMDKQMKILKNGLKEDPLSPYWDELVKNRVLAENLKQEITKFQSLVEYIEQLIFNLHVCQTLMDKVDKNLPALEKDLQILKELKDEQLKLNKKTEEDLLKLNFLDILKTEIK